MTRSVSDKLLEDQLLGMELNDAKALLQAEGVTFVVKYTKADRQKDFLHDVEKKHRIVRIISKNNEQELMVCIV